ncbi:hypothetical protein BY996DRAFT_6492418 [Phakopsora pachyrhizi]|nr:hypothetical protein BY996DRAFT_6492418 [Phakopsora pachyrhizi]
MSGGRGHRSQYMKEGFLIFGSSSAGMAPFPAMAARIGVEYFLAEDHCEPPASKMSFASMTADLSILHARWKKRVLSVSSSIAPNFCPGVGKGFIKAAMQVLGIAEVAPALDDEGPGGYLEAVLKGNKNSTSMFDLKELRAEFIVDGILKRYTDESVLIIKRDVRIGKVSDDIRIVNFQFSEKNNGPVCVIGTIKPQLISMEGTRAHNLPLESQLAIGLCRLGSNKNGASIGKIQMTFGVGAGTIGDYTKKIIQAILNLKYQLVMWPSKDECKGSSQVMQLEGFPKCIGFVDRTTILLSQKPALNGNFYFDCSYHDPYVFGQIDITINSESYFVPVPAYRVSNCSTPAKTEFNKRLAQEMRNHLRTPKEMKYLTQWVSACVVLHNLLAKIGDK